MVRYVRVAEIAKKDRLKAKIIYGLISRKKIKKYVDKNNNLVVDMEEVEMYQNTKHKNGRPAKIDNATIIDIEEGDNEQ